MRIREAYRRQIPHVAIFLLIAVGYASGLLEFLELKLQDSRFRLVERTASGDLILVSIDTPSLRNIGIWPWPRDYHAAVLDRLLAAGARRVAFDISFSSHSTPGADAVFAESLARASGRAVLPVFKQIHRPAPGENDVLVTEPVPALAAHAELASVNLEPDPDGLIRRMAPFQHFGGGYVPSLAAALLDADSPPPDEFRIDYGIRSSTIPRLSYVDVLFGQFDPAVVAGKSVLIGATASELGEQFTTPRYRWLMGVTLQALAFESMTQDRALRRLGGLPVLVSTFLLCVMLGRRFGGGALRRDIYAVLAWPPTMYLIAVAVQTATPITLDVVPAALVAPLSYAYALLRHVQQQDLRLISQHLTIGRQTAFIRKVLENSVEDVLTVDATGTVQSFGRGAERIFGYPPDRIIGRPVGHLLPEPAPDAVPFGAVAASRRTGSWETIGQHRDGRQFPVEVLINELSIGGASTYVLLIRDLSAQKQAEARAATARAQLNAAIECISEGFVLFSADDRLILHNGKFDDIVGGAADLSTSDLGYWPLMQAMATHGRLVTDAESDDGRTKAFDAAPAEFNGRFELQLDDGRHLQVSERRTDDGGRVAVYTDVSELKQREHSLRLAKVDAEAANKAKSDFLANMSHELRTPLNAVIGFAQMLNQEIFGPLGNDNYKAYSNDIETSAEHLLSLINDILDMAKIEAGKFTLDETDIDLHLIVDLCRRIVIKRFDEGELTLSVELPQHLPILHGDERALRQILLNLLSNAAKFTEPGGQVTVRGWRADDGTLRIAVTDTGIGMAPEDLPKALGSFDQVESHLSRRSAGTGLGLPLAKSMCELHGGGLELESELGKGSVVTFWFPAERVRDTADADHAA